MGSGAKPPRSWEFSRIVVFKVTLQSVRLLLTVSYRKKTAGAGCTCPVSCFPSFRAYGKMLDWKMSTIKLVHDIMEILR